MFVHFGNSCSTMLLCHDGLPFHDSMVSRRLSRADRIFISLVINGQDISWFALKNDLNLIPNGLIVIIRDTIPAAGLPSGGCPFGEQSVMVDEDRAAWSTGRMHFAGSVTTIPEMTVLLEKKTAYFGSCTAGTGGRESKQAPCLI